MSIYRVSINLKQMSSMAINSTQENELNIYIFDKFLLMFILCIENTYTN